jgi:hypothetical protein
MMLGGAGPGNLIQIASEPRAVEAALRVQFIGISACCLAGVGVLAARRWGPRRAPRRPLGLLVDSFALGLLLIAALFLCIVFVGGPDEVPAVEAVRRATFFVVGLAPIVFLIGLLQSRLAVGPAIVSLGTGAARGNVVDALRVALRDPSLEVAYWVPEYEQYADRVGRAIELPTSSGRATTLIDREDGTHVAALVHDVSLREEPALLEAVTAAGAFALENERLHAELRARLEELRGSRVRIIEAAQAERALQTATRDRLPARDHRRPIHRTATRAGATAVRVRLEQIERSATAVDDDPSERRTGGRNSRRLGTGGRWCGAQQSE